MAAVVACMVMGVACTSVTKSAPAGSGGLTSTHGSAAVAASAARGGKLPAKGCSLLDTAVAVALVGGPISGSDELRAPVALNGLVVGCNYHGAGTRQAGVVLHQSAVAADDFAANTSGPNFQAELGLGDKAMVHVAGGEEASIEVLKGDVDILIFGTRSGSDSEYAKTLKAAASMLLARLA